MLAELSNWWRYSSAVDVILEELINFGIITSKDSIISIDFNTPSHISSDFAVWVDKAPKNEALVLPGHSLLLRTEVINRIVNVWVNHEVLLKMIWPQFINSPFKQGLGISLNLQNRIAIEHTSLNTVFPINLATFRGTVIGDATRRYLLQQGASVTSHFFVEDLSQRIHALLTGVKLSKLTSDRLSLLEGKPDHEIGYLYSSTIMAFKRSGQDRQKLLSNMFPKAISRVSVNTCLEIEEFHWGEYAFDDLYLNLKTYCIEGFMQTLKLCNIEIDEYDHEAVIYKKGMLDDEFFVKSPSPLERNICYFKHLLSTNELVMSILPIDLVFQPNHNDSLVGKLSHTIKQNNMIDNFEDRLRFFPYGQVVVSEDHLNNAASDTISGGVFTSLDCYLENTNSEIQMQMADVINAIKLTFLGRNNNSSVLVMKTKLDKKGLYFDILSTLEKTSIILTDIGIKSSNDIYWSIAETRLQKSILGFERFTVEQIGQIPEFGKLVKATQLISTQLDEIANQILISKKLYSTQKRLLTITACMILNVFDLLGIVVSEGNLKEIRNRIVQTII